MSTGKGLHSYFAKASAGQKGELALFRHLLGAFNDLGPNTLAHEYHGTKHLVEFREQRGAGRGIPRCEIADLLLLTFSTSRTTMPRMTWIQAKVTSNCLHDGLVPGAFLPGAKFGGNLEQWDLLCHRPTILGGTKSFVPPPDLLSAAALPSVGSFGVFYPRGRSYEFAYIVADCLRPISNNSSAKGTLELCEHANKIRTFDGFDEQTTACCLRRFGDLLDSNLVGSPITPVLCSIAQREWLSRLLGELGREYPRSNLSQQLQTLIGGDAPVRGREAEQLFFQPRAVVVHKVVDRAIGRISEESLEF